MVKRSKTEIYSVNGAETGFSPVCRVITRDVRLNRQNIWSYAIFTNKTWKVIIK
jgi:hypothetical protein